MTHAPTAREMLAALKNAPATVTVLDKTKSARETHDFATTTDAEAFVAGLSLPDGWTTVVATEALS